MSGRVPPGGERAIYPVHAMPHKMGRQICLLRSKGTYSLPTSTELRGQAEVPKLEPQIEFSVGIFSHERVKHLNFTVRHSGAILRRNLPRTFHQLLLFCSVTRPPHPCSRRANLTIRTCLLAQGWRSTSTRSILITRSSCLVLQVRPRSDLDGLGAAVVSAAGWCSRAAILARRVLHLRRRSRGLWATSFHELSRRALFDGTLVRSRARCLSLCA